ncbi:hypothetical protein BKA69DRAFT_723392 [Paraphysoderma sedebokerense]|nr:hypothetical protein BKA69DRAFT_723392 [Paraphysoderma sedebokerense]
MTTFTTLHKSVEISDKKASILLKYISVMDDEIDEDDCQSTPASPEHHSLSALSRFKSNLHSSEARGGSNQSIHSTGTRKRSNSIGTSDPTQRKQTQNEFSIYTSLASLKSLDEEVKLKKEAEKAERAVEQMKEVTSVLTEVEKEHAETREELKREQERSDKAEAKIKELEMRLMEAEERNHKALQQLHHEQDRAQRNEFDLKEAERVLKNIHEDLASEKLRAKQAELAAKELAIQLDTAKVEFQQRLNQLETLVNEAENRVQAKQKEYEDNVKTLVSDHHWKINRLQSDHDSTLISLKSSMEEQTQQIGQLKTNLSVSHVRNAELEKEIAAFKQRVTDQYFAITQSANTISSQFADLSNLQQQKSQWQTELTNVKKTNAALESRITELNTRLLGTAKCVDEQRQKFQFEIQNLINKLEVRDVKIEWLNEKSGKLDKAVKEREKTIESMKIETENQHEVQRRLRDENGSLTESNQSKTEKISQLRSQASRLCEELNKQEDIIKNLSDLKKEAEERVCILTQSNEHLQKEVKDVKISANVVFGEMKKAIHTLQAGARDR